MNASTNPTPSGYRDVSPMRVFQTCGAENNRPATTRIIDVREPSEFNGDLGHIAEAELVPLATLEAFAKRWSKDQEIVLVCRSGGRSAQAAALLVAMGFAHVSNMQGGMLEWRAQRLPIA